MYEHFPGTGVVTSVPLDAGYTILTMEFDEGHDAIVAIVTRTGAVPSTDATKATAMGEAPPQEQYYVATVGTNGTVSVAGSFTSTQTQPSRSN
jgi:hypothetical protein